MYIPDIFNIKRLSRNFIFTLLYTIAPDTYKSLKKDVDINNENNKIKRLENAYIEVDENVFKSILEKKELKVRSFYI
jgi:hypothetical protein